MKRSLHFLTLMLTLALILSCGLQIFAEEIERLPSEPIFSTTPCSHNSFFCLPQGYDHEESIPGFPKCMMQVLSYDINTCNVCHHVWYTNGTFDHYTFHHIKGARGFCIYCFTEMS